MHVCGIAKQVFGCAALHGEKALDLVDDVGPSSIATFLSEDRVLSSIKIRLMAMAMAMYACASRSRVCCSRSTRLQSPTMRSRGS